MIEDVNAVRDRDPAARNFFEVFFLYPGVRAIRRHRVANWFHRHKFRFIARWISQETVRKTGIEIHPAVKIGRRLVIDHGTGIVIGETTTIGNRVKIYQGVTLGAKSFEVDENGNPVKNIKRHPDIGNHVVIYANATILGGTTRIGDHCTVGGNVWLVDSLAEGSTIIHNREDRIIRK